MIKFIFRCSGTILGSGLCCLLPGLLVYFLLYIPFVEWNNNSILTSCFIADHIITNETCYESCDCIQLCSQSTTSDICTDSCNTCSYDCYNGFIIIIYYDYDDQVHYKVMQICSYREYYLVNNELNRKYPINNNITCYYQENNPDDMKLELKNTQIAFIFFIILVVLFSLIIIIWLISEFLVKILKPKCPT